MESNGPISLMLKYDVKRIKEESRLVNLPTTLKRLQSEIFDALINYHCTEIVVSKKVGDILTKRLDGLTYTTSPIYSPGYVSKITIVENKIHPDVNNFVKLKIFDSELRDKILVSSDYEIVYSILEKSKRKYFKKIKISTTRYNRIKKYLYYVYDMKIVKVKDLKNNKCYIEIL